MAEDNSVNAPALDVEMEGPVEPAVDEPALDAVDSMNLDDTLDDTAGHDPDVVGKEINITPDGGLIKKILTKGTGWEQPETGDVVTVHYTGTLASDGSTFDSSRDRNEPFTFNLGEGRVIKGWDLGVATMKRGEKAVLTCRADYAYGDNGSPPKIPGGATLNFEVELLSWRSVKDLSGDGGVIKTIVKEGVDWQKPDDRDEVTVVYSAKVQGSSEPFASSGAEGVEFTVEQGLEGMKGLPIAIKTMKKEEQVTLVLKPEYAYGSVGRVGVPPDSTVVVDLELVSWKKVEDVTSDGLVIKKTLIDSKQWKKPNEGAKVTLRATGKLQDGTVFMSYPEGSELTFITDENQVPEGLDQAVMKMKESEKALITVAPSYGYGEAGKAVEQNAPGPIQLLAPVPPNATLTYELELVSMENAKESWDMSDQEKVEAAASKKEKANKLYRDGKTARAITLYNKASSLITNDKAFTDELKAQVREIKKAVHLNLAAAHIKQANHKQAIIEAGKVLDLDPINVKALYRRAQAYIAQGDYVEAEQDIKKGLIEHADNVDLLALHRKLKIMMRDQAKKESALYSKMFKPLPMSKAVAASKVAEAVAATNATNKDSDTTATQDNTAKAEAPTTDAQPMKVEAATV